MTTTWKWVIGIGVTLLAIFIVMWVIKRNKKARIKDAAIKTGVPEGTAEVIANSSDPEDAGRQAGLSPAVALAVSEGLSVVSVNPAFLNAPAGLINYGTSTFYGCPKGTSLRLETGENDENGNKLYKCFGPQVN